MATLQMSDSASSIFYIHLYKLQADRKRDSQHPLKDTESGKRGRQMQHE